MHDIGPQSPFLAVSQKKLVRVGELILNRLRDVLDFFVAE